MMAEARPGITYGDLMKMPFYEIMLKLEIIKRKVEERKAQEEGKSVATNHSLPNPNEYMRQAQTSMPKVTMPSLPSMPRF